MKNKFSLHLFTSTCLTLTSDRFYFRHEVVTQIDCSHNRLIFKFDIFTDVK